ncbi:SDR family NAD(P)-dependent oxidoreductase [Comamonas sp. F1-6]|uniref:SDR family NAD(P)-dependent oxidoreductase n=1 Tax=Comamonas sp. F1-6 TaxID=673550 RepID=UPI0031D93406
MRSSLKGANVLLFGGSGGIGKALLQSLARAGVASIVVAAHKVSSHDVVGVDISTEVIDVTSLASVQDLARRLSDRDIALVINSAGVNSNESLFSTNAALNARREMEVNCFGLMNVGLSFGPALAARGGGVLMNVLSFLSHASLPPLATYCASKSAAHSLNLSLRAELRPKGVRVCGVYPMAVDTSMSRDQQGPKMSPEMLAQEMVNFLAGDCEDLYPGEALHAYDAWLRDPRGFQAEMLSS